MVLGQITLFFGLVLDRIIGDPRSRFHPVALLGNFIGLWGKINRYPPKLERLLGVLFWLMTVIVTLIPCYLIMRFLPWYVGLLFSILALSFCIGWRSLEEHARNVENALKKGDNEGRKAV